MAEMDLEAAASAIPEVKKVIVAYGDKIAYENTLGEALASLFGDDADASEPGTSDSGSAGGDSGTKTQSDWIKQAADAYDDAQKALQSGDWAEYGKHMDKLEEALNQLS